MAVSGHYDPTSIIAGDFPLAKRAITVASGQNSAGTVLPRGTVLGQQTLAAKTAVSAVKASGSNTGNGTLVLDATTPVLANAIPGVYTARFTTTTSIRLSDPHGDTLADYAITATTGQTATLNDQVKGVVTEGSATFAAGDGFDITVANAIGTSSSAAKSGGNTGGGSLTLNASNPLLPNAAPGVYQVRFTSATAYTVTAPNGVQIGTGANGTPFANQVQFLTAASGAAFVAGDGFDVTVALNSMPYVLSAETASDGSQTPVCVLADDIDTSTGTVSCAAYFAGEFAYEMCNIDPSWTSLSLLNQAVNTAGRSLFFRSVGLVA